MLTILFGRRSKAAKVYKPNYDTALLSAAEEVARSGDIVALKDVLNIEGYQPGQQALTATLARLIGASTMIGFKGAPMEALDLLVGRGASVDGGTPARNSRTQDELYFGYYDPFRQAASACSRGCTQYLEYVLAKGVSATSLEAVLVDNESGNRRGYLAQYEGRTLGMVAQAHQRSKPAVPAVT